MTQVTTLTEQINSLKNDQEVTIKTRSIIHLNKVITGRVHCGITTCGRSFFYIQPVGDAHPGAAITKNEIVEIL